MCRFINRFSDGEVNYIRQPAVNLGRLDVKGWDVALRYKLPDTAWGSWSFGFDGTYVAQWDDTDPTRSDDAIVHLAGHFNSSLRHVRPRPRARVRELEQGRLVGEPGASATSARSTWATRTSTRAVPPTARATW